MKRKSVDAVYSTPRKSGSAITLSEANLKSSPSTTVTASTKSDDGGWRCVECGCPRHLTPIQRPGPKGKKTLCNACYIRSKVKRERAMRGSARPTGPSDSLSVGNSPALHSNFLHVASNLSASTTTSAASPSSHQPFLYTTTAGFPAYMPVAADGSTMPFWTFSAPTGTSAIDSAALYAAQQQQRQQQHEQLHQAVSQLQQEAENLSRSSQDPSTAVPTSTTTTTQHTNSEKDQTVTTSAAVAATTSAPLDSTQEKTIVTPNADMLAMANSSRDSTLAYYLENVHRLLMNTHAPQTTTAATSTMVTSNRDLSDNVDSANEDLDQPHGDTLSSPDHETTTSVPDTRKSDTEEDHIRKGRKKVV